MGWRTKEEAKKYYLENKERIAELQKIRNKTNPNYLISHKKAWIKWAKSPKGIYKALHQNSKKRGMEMDISQEEFINWYNQEKKECFYCNMPLDLVSITGVNRFTIDRVNNKKTYSLDNIVLACDWCNQVKGSILTKEEMLEVGQKVINKKWRNYV